MRIIVFFSNFGPYHIARARALNSIASVEASFIEIAGSEKKYSWNADVKDNDPKIYTVFKGSFEDAPLLSVFRECVRKIEELKADVLFIPGYHEKLWILLALWSKIRNKRTILMYDSHFLDHPRDKLKEQFKSLLIKNLFNRAFVAGIASKDYLKSLGFRGNIWMGYDVVDNDYFRDGAKEILSSQPYFIAINRLVAEKNIISLLHGYSLYHKLSPAPWKLLIVGDGPLEAEIREEINAINLEASVELRGFLQVDKVRPLLQEAGALILYSISEPWGLVVNEGLAARLPVIVSNRAGAAYDLVTQGKNGFIVSPYDISELAHSMLRVEYLTLEQRISFANHSEALLTHFTPETWAETIIAAAYDRH